jgi:hypothetical protein
VFLNEPEPGQQASDSHCLEQHLRDQSILGQPKTLSKTVERRPEQCTKNPRNAKRSQSYVPWVSYTNIFIDIEASLRTRKRRRGLV